MIRPTKPPFFLVNAFANEKHGGNQAAVVILTAMDRRVNDVEYMSNIARDFDLPMTAFVVPRNEDGTHYAIRWFTASGAESQLCGHATLASAFVLFTRFAADASTIYFDTKTKGRLSASRVASPNGLGIALTLPLGPATTAVGPSHEIGAIVARAAGINVSDIVEVATYDGGNSAVVELKPSVPLKDLAVDTGALTPTPAHYTILTQAAGGNRINSRVFVPSMGIPEDPVTGSAHAVLTEYYLQGPGRARLEDTSATSLDAYQVSSRGGAMKCEIVDNGNKAKVVGRAWITASGVLEL